LKDKEIKGVCDLISNTCRDMARKPEGNGLDGRLRNKRKNHANV
jgi:hypothetical protein